MWLVFKYLLKEYKVLCEIISNNSVAFVSKEARAQYYIKGIQMLYIMLVKLRGNGKVKRVNSDIKIIVNKLMLESYQLNL